MPRSKCKHKANNNKTTTTASATTKSSKKNSNKLNNSFIHVNGKMNVEVLTKNNNNHDVVHMEISHPHQLPSDFKTFQFIPRLIGDKNDSLNACLSMFEDLDFTEPFRPKKSTLRKFLLTVQKNYKQLPYHNWDHAFAVAHFCYLLLRTDTMKKKLKGFERLSLLVSSLCHDLNHPGTSNSFQIQYKTPLAALYNSEGSILEKHHFAQTLSILQSPDCDIFQELSRDDFQKVQTILHDTIMATDIAVHFSSTMPRLREISSEGFNIQDSSHRNIFLCLTITASDISEQCKKFSHAKYVAANLYKEFFLQGDQEKEIGGTPIEMMDRERGFIPKMQVDFMDNATIPTFRFLNNLIPEVGEILPCLKFNRNCWAAMDRIMKEDGFSHIYGNLDVLEDKSVEERILNMAETWSEVDEKAEKTKK